MKKVVAALSAESPALERLVRDVLAGEGDISLCRTEPGRAPDVQILAGESPEFFLERGETFLQADSVVCVGPAPAGCRGPVPLPTGRDARALERFRKALVVHIKSAHAPSGTAAPTARRLVGIGASTGGPQILLTILRDLPRSTCGILVVQHFTPGFSSRFSEYLAPLCNMLVKQAEDGERVEDGVVYLAEDGHHLTAERLGGGFRLRSRPGEKINGFCPSADRLFESLADQAGPNAMGVVLTGMGDDGARGLRRLREKGGLAVAQDEGSCVVPSMPREAVRLGGAAVQLSPAGIAQHILQFSNDGDTV